MKITVKVHPTRLILSAVASTALAVSIASAPAAHAGIYRHGLRPMASMAKKTTKVAGKGVWWTVKLVTKAIVAVSD